MAQTALKAVDNTASAPSRVHVHARETPQMPALVEPGHAVIIPPGAFLPMPEPEARVAMSTACARLEALEEQLAELNAQKSGVFKELRDLGFNVAIVRQLRKERGLDPTLRQVNSDLMRLYERLLTNPGE